MREPVSGAGPRVRREHGLAVSEEIAPKGSRVGLGAPLLGYYKGRDLVYAGKVGTGFDDATLPNCETPAPELRDVEAAAGPRCGARAARPGYSRQP